MTENLVKRLEKGDLVFRQLATQSEVERRPLVANADDARFAASLLREAANHITAQEDIIREVREALDEEAVKKDASCDAGCSHSFAARVLLDLDARHALNSSDAEGQNAR